MEKLKLNRISVIVLFLIYTGFFSNSFAQENCRLLVWSDEFDYSGHPDSLKWGYDVGDGCDYGLCNWGNLEAQYYTYRDLDNARVENGSLIIEARKELTVNKKYSSARLTTRDIMAISHGRIEYRAKLPGGAGTWSALWLLGDRVQYGWPDCGEIDVLEYVGSQPGIARGTVHQRSGYGGEGPTMAIAVPDAETEFHIYAVEWDSDSIVWFVDDQKYHVYYNEHSGEAQWPYDRSFNILMNLAIGGTLGGPIDNDIFDSPVMMEIDYVRVYQQTSEAAIQGKQLIIKNEADLEYSCQIPANKYTWTVPEGISINSGQGTSAIVVNWNCDEGAVKLELETDCDTTILELLVSFSATEIEGRISVYQGETSLLYSVPTVTDGVYNWTVPEDAIILDGASKREVELNWGCSEGQIQVDISGSCLNENVNKDVGIVPFKIDGPGYLSQGAKNNVFVIDSLFEGTFLWSVPEDVVINSGAGTNSIDVNWGSSAGYVVASVTNICGILKDSMLVNITSDLVIADFDVVDPEFLVFGGSKIEKTGNPSKTGINVSDLVGLTYKDATAMNWGGFYTDLEETMDFSSGATFTLMTYAPHTGNVLFKLESNSSLAADLELLVPITETNQWEKLFFDFEDAATNSYDRLALFFDFGQVFTDTFYFDNVILIRNSAADITLTQEAQISEGNEDGMAIKVKLHGDLFVSTLSPSNWTFASLPEGVTVGSINRLSDTEVELLLSGNASSDYDDDITNFTVSFTKDELVNSESGLSVNTGVVFTALLENNLKDEWAGLINVYPNPVADILTIEMDFPNKEMLKGQVIGLRGEVTHNFFLPGNGKYSIDLSGYQPGSYLLILKGEDMVFQKQIIRLGMN